MVSKAASQVGGVVKQMVEAGSMSNRISQLIQMIQKARTLDDDQVDNSIFCGC